MKKVILSLLCLTWLVGCGAGSGEGLDENGQPIVQVTPTPNPDSTVTLADIQAEIFDDPCSICHTGSGAPQGLRLDSEDNSYNLLVGADGNGVPANEVPELLRVDPGNPDDSYLVRKIEGGPDIVGGQMPLDMTPLSEEQIGMIRDWIANGAPRTGTGDAAASVSKASVLNPSALNPTALNQSLDVVFQLRFSRAIQQETLTESSVQVYFLNAGQQRLADSTEYELQIIGRELEIRIKQPIADADSFAVVVNDPTLSSVLDIDGRMIDGDKDNVDGGAYRYVYPL